MTTPHTTSAAETGPDHGLDTPMRGYPQPEIACLMRATPIEALDITDQPVTPARARCRSTMCVRRHLEATGVSTRMWMLRAIGERHLMMIWVAPRSSRPRRLGQQVIELGERGKPNNSWRARDAPERSTYRPA